MSKPSDRIVIAGAGVAGLYAAWRLIESGHDPARIQVLEAGDRLGGRLWSLQMRDDSSLPAELGGMFFNDQQPLVYGLCKQVFKLPMAPVSPVPDFAWLRARRFKVAQFADPNILPYQLAPDEQGLSYGGLLMLAVERIAPDIKQYWPYQPEGSRADSLVYLRHLKVDGRFLYDWGFWNLLARVISNEAWQALRDIVSSYTLFANWNGYDAVVSIVLEQAGDWYRLVHGYQQLPEQLADAVRQSGASIQLGHALQRVALDPGQGFTLAVDAQGKRKQIKADCLILALGRHPMAELVDASPDLQSTALASDLDAISAVPACKIFLTFDQPWWRDVPDGPGQIQPETYGVSHTDLPLRQCYYLGMDEASGQGLMMASYADGLAVEFWKALSIDSGRLPTLMSPLSPRALAEIQRQLAEMHGLAVPAPIDGVFINWTQPPFGGAWHNWQPGYRSWECSVRMRRPVPGQALHVCGEAWSEAQGWVEGALATTEAMLQQEFKLSAPEWSGPKITTS
jgi:monoamine oxidase